MRRRAFNNMILTRRLRLVIQALDQPYRGDLGIRPHALQLIHDQLMTH